MQRIIDFVSGKLTYSQFEALFTEDPSLWELAQSLLTQEILTDDHHPFWTRSNRSRLESNNYCVQYACLSFGYDAVGKVVTHRLLGDLVRCHNPEVVLRDPPEMSLDDLREKLGMDYLGGAEVDHLIDEILSKKGEDISVSRFITAAKKELKDLFHLTPRKYPRWVQEPEWPMGENSPMMFCSQKQEGELVLYTFQDADTQRIRVMEQYY